LVAVAEFPVLVGEVPDRFQALPVGEVYLVPVAKRGEERRPHGRDNPVAVLDLHRVAHREQLLADKDKNVAVGVLELEGFAQAERSPVDEEDPVPVLVLDPEVGRDGEDPFLDQISHDIRLYA
jgi:hypothetical protein